VIFIAQQNIIQICLFEVILKNIIVKFIILVNLSDMPVNTFVAAVDNGCFLSFFCIADFDSVFCIMCLANLSMS